MKWVDILFNVKLNNGELLFFINDNGGEHKHPGNLVSQAIKIWHNKSSNATVQTIRNAIETYNKQLLDNGIINSNENELLSEGNL